MYPAPAMDTTPASPADTTAREEQALTRAVAKVAEFWALGNEQLGEILGLSDSTVSRLRNGRLTLKRGTKSFELAQYLVRLFRSLDALMGSDDAAARSWLATHNLDLQAAPIRLLGTVRGLVTVCDYVDAFRARI